MDRKYIKAIINFARVNKCAEYSVEAVAELIRQGARKCEKSVEQYLDMYLQ